MAVQHDTLGIGATIPTRIGAFEVTALVYEDSDVTMYSAAAADCGETVGIAVAAGHGVRLWQTIEPSHPHVATVRALDHLRDGRELAVFDLNAARPLADVIPELEAVDPEARFDLMRQFADAAVTVDQLRGPGHLLAALAFVEEDGRLRLIPYREAPPDGFSRATPPEVARGRPWNAAADVYALGARLHEILTGHEFERVPARLDALVGRLPAFAWPRTPSFPPPSSTQDVIVRAVAERPSERYVHVAEVASALTQVYVAHRDAVKSIGMEAIGFWRSASKALRDRNARARELGMELPEADDDPALLRVLWSYPVLVSRRESAEPWPMTRAEAEGLRAAAQQASAAITAELAALEQATEELVRSTQAADPETALRHAEAAAALVAHGSQATAAWTTAQLLRGRDAVITSEVAAILEQARAEIAAGRIGTGVALCELAATLKPGDEEAATARARAGQALDEHDRAIARHMTDILAGVEQALKEQRLEEALTRLDAAREMAPADSRLVTLERRARHLAVEDAATRMREGWEHGLIRRAQALQADGRCEDAIRTLVAAAGYSPAAAALLDRLQRSRGRATDGRTPVRTDALVERPAARDPRGPEPPRKQRLQPTSQGGDRTRPKPVSPTENEGRK
jgi:hypothetical protein